MRRALDLAAAVDPAAVTPNPRVGAVIVRDGEAIGAGAHERLGGLHAERAALLDCESRGHSAEGSTVHVTLEPCAHEGRQPPCADALIDAKVARVVIASDDSSPKASGRGPAALAERGIEVSTADPDSPEAAMARALNQPFRKHAATSLPLVTVKVAMSIDGRAAASSGDSKWISGEESRALVHRWRAGCDAIAAGIGTVLADDPLLTARGPGAERQPLRVVFDSEARLPLGSQLVSTVSEAQPVLAIVWAGAGPEAVAALEQNGVRVLTVEGETPADRAAAVMAALGAEGITHLFVEGGPTLSASFLAADEGRGVDVIRAFVAPILLGGDHMALDPVALPVIADAERYGITLESEAIGPDVLLTARLREW